MRASRCFLVSALVPAPLRPVRADPYARSHVAGDDQRPAPPAAGVAPRVRPGVDRRRASPAAPGHLPLRLPRHRSAGRHDRSGHRGARDSDRTPRRRPPQRNLRKPDRDHRLGAAHRERAAGGGQGVADRVDPGERPARARRLVLRRRPAAQGAAVLGTIGQRPRGLAVHGRDRPHHADHLRAQHERDRARPAGGLRGRLGGPDPDLRGDPGLHAAHAPEPLPRQRRRARTAAMARLAGPAPALGGGGPGRAGIGAPDPLAGADHRSPRAFARLHRRHRDRDHRQRGRARERGHVRGPQPGRDRGRDRARVGDPGGAVRRPGPRLLLAGGRATR